MQAPLFAFLDDVSFPLIEVDVRALCVSCRERQVLATMSLFSGFAREPASLDAVPLFSTASALQSPPHSHKYSLIRLNLRYASLPLPECSILVARLDG